MKVILYRDVENLGKTGDLVNVKSGFARNFLIRKGLALEATEKNLKQFEIEKKRKQKFLEQEKKKAEEISLSLEGISLTIPVETKEDGSLYGSVGISEILKALEIEGIKMEKRFILLESPIKNLGIYEVPIRLHPEVETKIKVWIVRK